MWLLKVSMLSSTVRVARPELKGLLAYTVGEEEELAKDLM